MSGQWSEAQDKQARAMLSHWISHWIFDPFAGLASVHQDAEVAVSCLTGRPDYTPAEDAWGV